MAAPATVFVVTLQAVAGPRNSVPDGRRYDILAFARAANEAEAEQVALRGLDQLGWIRAKALRAGEIIDPDAIPDDLVRNYERALAAGCAVIVYDQP